MFRLFILQKMRKLRMWPGNHWIRLVWIRQSKGSLSYYVRQWKNEPEDDSEIIRAATLITDLELGLGSGCRVVSNWPLVPAGSGCSYAKPNPHCDGIWRWDLWQVIRSWGWSYHELDQCPYSKKYTAELSYFSAMWGRRKKSQPYMVFYYSSPNGLRHKSSI